MKAWWIVMTGLVMLAGCASRERLPECRGRAVPVNAPMPAPAAHAAPAGTPILEKASADVKESKK